METEKSVELVKPPSDNINTTIGPVKLVGPLPDDVSQNEVSGPALITRQISGDFSDALSQNSGSMSRQVSFVSDGMSRQLSDLSLDDASIKESEPDDTMQPGMLRQPSVETNRSGISGVVSNQTTHPTCWGFSAAKIILKFIRNSVPDLRTSQNRNIECDKYYNLDEFKKAIIIQQPQGAEEDPTQKSCCSFLFGCFRNASEVANSDLINSGICGESEYLNLCVYMFIYFKLTEQFGCDRSCNVCLAVDWFVSEYLSINKGQEKLVIDLIKVLKSKTTKTTTNPFPEPYNSVALTVIAKFCHIVTTPIYVNDIVYNRKNGNIQVITNRQMYFHILSSADDVLSDDDDDVLSADKNENALSELITPVIQHDNNYLSVVVDLFGDDPDIDNKHSEKKIDFYSYKGTTIKKPEYGNCLEDGLKDSTPVADLNNHIKKSLIHTMTIVGKGVDGFIINNSWGERVFSNTGVTDLLGTLSPYGLTAKALACPADLRSKESYYRRYTNSYDFLPFSSDEEAAPGTVTIYARNTTFEIPFRRLTLAWDATDVHSDGYGYNGVRADNTVYSRTNKPTYE
jgi:hypothetical protein